MGNRSFSRPNTKSDGVERHELDTFARSEAVLLVHYAPETTKISSGKRESVDPIFTAHSCKLLTADWVSRPKEDSDHRMAVFSINKLAILSPLAAFTSP